MNVWDNCDENVRGNRGAGLAHSKATADCARNNYRRGKVPRRSLPVEGGVKKRKWFENPNT